MSNDKPGDIFKSFKEDENPPYQEWIMIEADGDLRLADLIEKREILFDDVNSHGGLSRLESEEEQLRATQNLNGIYDQILQRKIQLGLELPKE